MEDYIIIAESGTGALTKRFKATQMIPRIEVPRQATRTIGGDRDIHYGGVLEEYRYMLLIPTTVTSTDYGTWANFKTIVKRNNPNGTVTPRFTFTDHFGNTHTDACFGDNEHAFQPLSTLLSGDGAKYLVPVIIFLKSGDPGV